MTTDSTHLIIGASLARAKAAEMLRAEAFDGPLVLIGEENDQVLLPPEQQADRDRVRTRSSQSPDP